MVDVAWTGPPMEEGRRDVSTDGRLPMVSAVGARQPRRSSQAQEENAGPGDGLNNSVDKSYG